MKTLNQMLWSAAYEYACMNWDRPYLACDAGKINNPAMAKLAHPALGQPGLFILTLNVRIKACAMHPAREGLFFAARFGGKEEECLIPWDAMFSLYDSSNPASSPERTGSITLNAFLSSNETSPVEEEVKPTPVARPKFSVVPKEE